ncbi:MAG: hypothetical protein WBX25_24940 [Rhodomicrobium sp.]
MLGQEILNWPEAKSGCDIRALTHHLIAKFNRPLAVAEVEDALNCLAARELVKRDGEMVRKPQIESS